MSYLGAKLRRSYGMAKYFFVVSLFLIWEGEETLLFNSIFFLRNSANNKKKCIFASRIKSKKYHGITV